MNQQDGKAAGGKRLRRVLCLSVDMGAKVVFLAGRVTA